MKTLIFWPVLMQITIPFWIMILNGLRKNTDRKSGQVNPDSPINNKAWSLPVILTSNALENQFQFPVVFYVLCLILVQLDSVTAFSLVLSWLFVVSRWLHALIHVTSNVISLRMVSFLIGMITLLLLFVNTALAMLGSQL